MIKLNNKESRYLIISVVALILIWTLGPYLAIANKVIFPSIGSRLIPSILIILIWGIYFIYNHLALAKAKKEEFSPLQNVIEDLESQMQIALDSIHTLSNANSIDRLKKTKPTPWVLLIGARGSGKTNLLAQSKLKLESPLKKSLTDPSPTQTIDWWISDEGVFIDPSGKYCMALDEESQNHSYWEQFLKSIAKNHAHPFDSVCIVVDLPSLIYHEEATFLNLIKRIQQQIYQLNKLCSPLCLNIVVSQCDQITGFAEYFSNLKPSEQNESLGFSLIDPENRTHVSDLFKTRYEAFLKMINQRLCDRLHHEPNLNRRIRISDFPSQLERLLDPLYKIIASIPDKPNIVVNNVFFCSAKQGANTLNLFSENLNNAFAIDPAPTSPLVAKSQPLFIDDMLLMLTKPLAPEAAIIKALPEKWWHILSYPAALLIVLGATCAFHYSYQKNVKVLKSISNDLGAINSKTTWLTELNNLATTKEQLQGYSLTKSQILGFNQAHQIKIEVNSTYHNFLRTQFINYLNQALVYEIKIESDNNSPSLYNTLRVYLMLAQPKRLNPEFVTLWFQSFWQKQLPQDKLTQKRLNGYLQSALKFKTIHWTQQQDLIDNAQHILQQQPLSQIAFKMLRNENSLETVPINAKESVSGLDTSKARIPAFYSTHEFESVYKIKIPQLAKSMLSGNWVIGKTKRADINFKQLTSTLRNIYLQHYLSEWQSSLNEITFDHPKTLTDAIDQINLLTNAQSPLWQLYQSAIDTAKNAGAEIDTQTLTSYMPGINISNPMVQTLKQLQKYLTQINQAPSSIKASFDLSKKRFQDNGANDAITLTLQTADKMPTPIKQWMNTLAINAWRLMLSNSKVYLNTLWKTDIVTVYNETIKDRYPVFNSKPDDISIEDFNQFFGPGGVLQGFFNSYLGSFINTSQSYWTWKKQNGLSLDIPQNYLDMMIRASFIQKMFYTNNSAKPSFRFILKPLDMSVNSSQFILNVGGQMIRYLPGVKKTSKLSWPGPDGNFVTMRFNNPQEDDPTLTTMGSWAWLRILDHATITPSSDSRLFKVDFTLKNNDATYQLIADNPINPYIPNVLDGFRCPETL